LTFWSPWQTYVFSTLSLGFIYGYIETDDARTI
jgi:hypothetical protein